jgi:hypothetical protein
MKKLIFLLLLTSSLIACKKEEPGLTETQSLVGDWTVLTINQVYLDGTPTRSVGVMPRHSYIFSPDFSYIFIRDSRNSSKGVYTYDEQSNYLSLRREGSLEASYLVMKIDIGKTMKFRQQRSDGYLEFTLTR